MNYSFRILGSAGFLVGLSTFVPEVARADASCPSPTLVQCRSEAYRASVCGQAAVASETSPCTLLLTDAYKSGVQAPDVVVDQVMLPHQPGVTGAVATRKYKDFSQHLAQDFTGQFLGTEQRSQLVHAGGVTLTVLDGKTLSGVNTLKLQRAAWEANGNAVTSCSEYATERYMDYVKWKDVADGVSLSDDALYAAAFDVATGIANRTLRSKSGLSSLPSVVWPSNGVVGTIVVGGQTQPVTDPKSAKNGYFKAYRALAKSGFFGPSDAPLQFKLRAGSSHHVTDWNWHKKAHDTLAPLYDAETLRHFDAKQVDFLRDVTARGELVELVKKYGPTLTTGNPPSTRDLAAELAAKTEAVRTQLTEAENEGCLDAVNPTKCDWSYRLLRDDIVSFYSKEMEASFQKCVTNTGDDFSPQSPVRNALSRYSSFAGGRQDFSNNAEGVDSFGDVVRSWIAAQNFPKKADGSPDLGDRKSDSGAVGSRTISLKWAYDTGWNIGGLARNTESCSANLSVDGSFSSSALVMGSTFNLIDSRAKVFTERPKGKAQVKLVVADEVVWDRWDNPYTTELQTSLVKEVKSGTSKEYSATFYPFGIPTTVSIGLGMSVGMKMNASAKVGGGCSPTTTAAELASIQGTVTPWIQTDAFGSAAIGVPGFRGGLKMDVVVVRGEMPITANASISMNQARVVNASMSLSGRQKFRMLDGSVKAFVDGPFDFMDTETTLFSWRGPSIDQEVFRIEKAYPLTAISASL